MHQIYDNPCQFTFDGEAAVLSEIFVRLVIVGDVVVEVNEVDSIVVKDEKVLKRLLRLLEKDIEPSKIPRIKIVKSKREKVIFVLRIGSFHEFFSIFPNCEKIVKVKLS